jgi:hypothetical protein
MLAPIRPTPTNPIFSIFILAEKAAGPGGPQDENFPVTTEAPTDTKSPLIQDRAMRSIAFALAGFVVVSHAGISIPKNVLRSDQMKAARADAEKEKKGSSFVLTDPDISCGLCIAASDEAFDTLRSHSVVVFLGVKDNNRWAGVSPMVLTGFSEPKMGRRIPRAVVTSSDMPENRARLSCKVLEKDGTHPATKKRVEAMLEGGARAGLDPGRVIPGPDSRICPAYRGAGGGRTGSP